MDIGASRAVKGIHEELRKLTHKFLGEQRISELQFLRNYREEHIAALKSIASSLDILANKSFFPNRKT